METDHPTDEVTSGFAAPFTKDALKKDILDVMLILINQTRFAFYRDSQTEMTIWSLLSKKPLDWHGAVADPDMTPETLGLSFSDVEGISLVQDLLQFYDYGMHGILDTSLPDFDDGDGGGNWLSRILYDLRRSSFLEDWSGYKEGHPSDAVDRCLVVAELANARLMLEGGQDGFFLGYQNASGLDIRQVSLLSGMTEASIRTLAGPNRKNRLLTKKNGNSTYVEIEDAKAWLISKGRYVPIRRTSGRGADDFTGRKFFSRDDFEEAIECRRAFLAAEHGESLIRERIAQAGIVPVVAEIPNTQLTMQMIGNEQLMNADLMRQLAIALQLPAELFALRAAEAVTQERLRTIESQLRQIQTTPTRTLKEDQS